MASHMLFSWVMTKVKESNLCVGVSLCYCGWVIISVVLLSNQQLLIDLTVQINKASHLRDVSLSVCAHEGGRERDTGKCFTVA